MSTKLNKKDVEKFSRQIILKNIGALGQKKILSSKVLIIGMGGLGCPAADFLTRSGTGTLGIVDNDTVGLSNLHRQSLYNEKDLNQSKVKVAKKKLNKINSNTKVDIFNLKLNDKEFDLFYAISHGVHRGILREGKLDERELFIKRLLKYCKDVNFDIYGMFNKQPIWGEDFLNVLSESKMGLNLSRGKPVKYYSSDRIAQLIGNGILTFIDIKTKLNKLFTDNEIIFYKNIKDLSNKINFYKNSNNLRNKIAKNGMKKYHKYMNSKIIASFIIDKTLNINKKKRYFWENK